MKIIIAGGGKVGAKLTRMLSAEEHEIVLIDSKSKVAGDKGTARPWKCLNKRTWRKRSF